jgi:hypothetical protein
VTVVGVVRSPLVEPRWENPDQTQLNLTLEVTGGELPLEVKQEELDLPTGWGEGALVRMSGGILNLAYKPGLGWHRRLVLKVSGRIEMADKGEQRSDLDSLGPKRYNVQGRIFSFHHRMQDDGLTYRKWAWNIVDSTGNIQMSTWQQKTAESLQGYENFSRGELVVLSDVAAKDVHRRIELDPKSNKRMVSRMRHLD